MAQTAPVAPKVDTSQLIDISEIIDTKSLGLNDGNSGGLSGT